MTYRGFVAELLMARSSVSTYQVARAPGAAPEGPDDE